jgi:hypothetical protein
VGSGTGERRFHDAVVDRFQVIRWIFEPRSKHQPDSEDLFLWLSHLFGTGWVQADDGKLKL